MPRKTKTTGKAIVPANPNTNLPMLPERFAVGGTEVRPTQLFHNRERHPRGRGPWTEEPDKLAWVDEVSGYDCIALRSASGAWGGYVGLPHDHPLHGFRADAIPASLDIEVHGGIDYAALCSHRGPEEVRICHAVSPASTRGRVVPARAQGLAVDDTWWLGFCCDKPGDLVPTGPKPFHHREEGEVYRSLDYVYHEITGLARCLKDIAESGSAASPQALLGAPAPRLGKS